MTRPRGEARRIKGKGLGVLLLCVAVAVSALPAAANPFETLPPGHWAYDALEGLVSLDLGRSYVRQRLSVGAPLTYFDLALWVGDTLDAMRAVAAEHRGGDWSQASLEEIVAAYNEAKGAEVMSRDRTELLRSLVELSSVHLEVLGYAVPRDAGGGGESPTRSLGLTGLFEAFRLRGEGRIRYRDAGGPLSPGYIGDGESEFEQSYSLQVTGPVSGRVRIGADITGQTKTRTFESSDFSLTSGGLDIGISHTAIARLGDVSPDGLNPLVFGGTNRLSGLRAGVNAGQVESNLLVASVPAGEGSVEGEGSVVAAWDGSVQVSDRLSLGATVAGVQPPEGDADERSDAVFRIGGTYTVFPSLTLAGEMAQSRAERQGALRVGAVLHPIPGLTLGAFLFSAEPGYRPLLSRDRELSRLDLSAEVGRWILSFRRQTIVRASDEGEEGARVTRFALEYPVAPSAVARASHERDGGDAEGSRTEFDLEVRLENGKVILGYALEMGKRGEGTGDASRRTTRASVEHAVGPETRAQAGFLIVDESGGSETVSNVGLQYQLGNASVSLQYEIFTRSGDAPKNVTTAEVAIRF